MIHSRNTKPSKNEICFVRKRVGTLTLCYTLSALSADGQSGVRYVIENAVDNGIVTESKRCICPCTCTEKAEKIFEAVVRGNVTPCTLAEIISDFK